MFTYDGRRPYTGAPLHEVTEDAGGFFQPGPSWLATEHWAAVVDDGGFGIGLFKPDLVRFAGTPGTPGGGWVNGYLAASTTEVIDANQVYDYDYALVVGSLRQIRAYAYDQPSRPRPELPLPHRPPALVVQRRDGPGLADPRCAARARGLAGTRCTGRRAGGAPAPSPSSTSARAGRRGLAGRLAGVGPNRAARVLARAIGR